MQIVQRGHPGGNLTNSQVVTEHKIFLCLLRLLLQRPDLHLKLFYLIVDAEQILICTLQAAFCLFLSIAITRNSRSLIKDLTPVGAFGGDNIRYFPLADDGIAVTPEARVKEQSVDILQANLFPVDEVFTVSAAVIPPCQLHFRAVAVENAGSVIDD